MNVRQIIAKLQSLGYQVEYTQRFERLSKSDIKKYTKLYPEKAEYYATQKFARGVRITAIDGIKFSGSRGNESARQMLGENLTIKRQQQLQRIQRPKLEALPKEIETALRRAQRLANKLRKEQSQSEALDPKKSIPKITKKNIRYTYKKYGIDATLTQISDYERKIKKLVPTWLWDQLVAEINAMDSTLIAFAEESDDSRKDEWIESWNDLVSLINSANIDKVNYYDDYLPLLEMKYIIMEMAGVNTIIDTLPTLNNMLSIVSRLQ